MQSWTLHQTRRVLALGIGSCLALSACSPSERNESEDNHGAQRSGRTTLFSLLGSFDKACIQRAPEGAQIRVDLLQPANKTLYFL